MYRKKRCIERLFVSFLVVSLIVLSCLSGWAQEKGKTDVVVLSAGVAEVERVWMDKWVGICNKVHPDINTRLELVPWTDLTTKTLAYIAAGTAPDLAWYGSDQMSDWYNMGILEPLDEWLGDDKCDYVDAVLSPESEIIRDGKMYGAPFTMVPGALATRKDLLANAGIDVFSIKTWDDYLEAAAALNGVCDGAMFAMGEPRMPYLTGSWWATSNGLGKLTDFSVDKEKNMRQLIQFFSDVFNYVSPSQVGWKFHETMVAWCNDLVGMHATGGYWYGAVQPMCPDVLTEKKTTFIPIPYGPSRKTPLTVVYTVGYVLFKDSHHKAEAAEVLKFLTKGEAIKEWPMNLCPKKGVTLDERVAALPFGEAVRWFEKEMREIVNATETRSWDSTAPAEETYRIFNKNFVELYKKKVTPEEMYRNLRAEIVPLQEELK